MVYVFLADGFEEVEAILPIDLMRRAGIDVSLVGVGAVPAQSHGSHNIIIHADCTISDVEITEAEALVFPGGMPGVANLANNADIISLIQQQIDRNGIVAAICASPAFVLGAHGFLRGKKFTGYPGTESSALDAHYIADEDVVQDGNIITSRGVGTAHKFGYVLIETLLGKEQAEKVYKACLFTR